uniref:Hypothetical 11.7K protein n=1 Tax=Beet cryptic virus 3 TaxID=29257 RepID=Q7LZW9_9VIRU
MYMLPSGAANFLCLNKILLSSKANSVSSLGNSIRSFNKLKAQLISNLVTLESKLDQSSAYNHLEPSRFIWCSIRGTLNWGSEPMCMKVVPSIKFSSKGLAAVPSIRI